MERGEGGEWELKRWIGDSTGSSCDCRVDLSFNDTIRDLRRTIDVSSVLPLCCLLVRLCV